MINGAQKSHSIKKQGYLTVAKCITLWLRSVCCILVQHLNHGEFFVFFNDVFFCVGDSLTPNIWSFDSSFPEGVEMTFNWTILSVSADTEPTVFMYLSQKGKDTLADKPCVFLYIDLLASSFVKIHIFDAVQVFLPSYGSDFF